MLCLCWPHADVYAEGGLQIVRFSFNNIAQSDPERPFSLRLSLKDSEFKGKPPARVHIICIRLLVNNVCIMSGLRCCSPGNGSSSAAHS